MTSTATTRPDLSGTRVAITGGAGFIGSALAERLAADPSIEVVLFDNLHHDAVQGTPLLAKPNVTLVRGDVRDKAAVARALEGAHHIVHMASIAGVDTVMQAPVLTMQVSLQGTMHVLRDGGAMATTSARAARLGGCKQIGRASCRERV